MTASMSWIVAVDMHFYRANHRVDKSTSEKTTSNQLDHHSGEVTLEKEMEPVNELEFASEPPVSSCY